MPRNFVRFVLDFSTSRIFRKIRWIFPQIVKMALSCQAVTLEQSQKDPAGEKLGRRAPPIPRNIIDVITDTTKNEVLTWLRAPSLRA